MTRAEAIQLFEKYQSGSASSEEKLLLENWYHQEVLQQKLSETEADFFALKDQIWSGVLERTGIAGELSSVKVLLLWKKLTIAASVALIIGIGGYFVHEAGKVQTEQIVVYTKDIQPGSNNATLTLANGKKITLSEVANGKLAEEAGVRINKADNGQLTYTVIDNQVSSENKINTLSTAMGQTYSIVLPDGSRVWLNAASSLRYPASFSSAAERRVQLTGEGYFEVAKDKAHPFIVQTAKQDVAVLGTHFNVNAYADEPVVRTTLLEGSVKVNTKGFARTNEVLLKPGLQAELNPSGSLKVTEGDPEVVAWKDGKFRFNNASLETVLRQLSRWYDVEIKYEAGVPDESFTGGISRDLKASEALEVLKYLKVNFKIEGKTIIVNK